jgi:hypothetical protein
VEELGVFVWAWGGGWWGVFVFVRGMVVVLVVVERSSMLPWGGWWALASGP